MHLEPHVCRQYALCFSLDVVRQRVGLSMMAIPLGMRIQLVDLRVLSCRRLISWALLKLLLVIQLNFTALARGTRTLTHKIFFLVSSER